MCTRPRLMAIIMINALPLSTRQLALLGGCLFTQSGPLLCWNFPDLSNLIFYSILNNRDTVSRLSISVGCCPCHGGFKWESNTGSRATSSLKFHDKRRSGLAFTAPTRLHTDRGGETAFARESQRERRPSSSRCEIGLQRSASSRSYSWPFY
jgi:hypothetical protein